MKNCFAKKRRDLSLVRELLLPLIFFIAVIGLFWLGLNNVTRSTETERLRSTQQAVTRAAVHCYAIEGAYPPDLAYLEEHYGLSIDHERYTVQYSCFAANLMPDISVVPKDPALFPQS